MSIATQSTDRAAITDADLIPVLRDRGSPRSFDATAEVEDVIISTVLEAARWAPSAMNSQPWRFIVAKRGNASFAKIHESLMGFNKVWADSASVLLVALTETEDAEGKPRPWAQYDLGQAVSTMIVQASAEGLHAHQMAGFDADHIRASFDVEAQLAPITVVALGYLGAADALPDVLREREIAPRERKSLSDIVLVQD